MNPFIQLTRIKKKGITRINVNHIISYEERGYSNSAKKYTYILILGGDGCKREVEETPEQIAELISNAVLSIPFTGISGA